MQQVHSYMRCLLIFALLMAASPSHSLAGLKTEPATPGTPTQNEEKTKLIEALDAVQLLMNTYYLDMRNGLPNKTWRWKLEHLRAEIKKDGMTAQRFQEKISAIVRSVRDLHSYIYSTAPQASDLAFSVRGAQGRYFIHWIDRKRLPIEKFPYEVGDEIIGFGNRPVGEVIAELRRTVRRSNLATTEGLAQLALTARFAARNVPVGSGPVEIKIHRRGASAEDISAITLEWNYVEDNPNSQHPVLDPVRLGFNYRFLPRLGKVIWENTSDSFFDSYISQLPDGKLVGYLRITDFAPGSNKPEDYTKAVAQFRALLMKMEAVTSSLILDISDNVGGNDVYPLFLASHFFNRKLGGLKYHITVETFVPEATTYLEKTKNVTNDQEAVAALGMENWAGVPVTYAFVETLRKFWQKILDHKQQGVRVTPPEPIRVDFMEPSPVQFTKPVVLIVNERARSAADIFASYLQDNNRAVLFGNHTGGALGFKYSKNPVAKDALIGEVGLTTAQGLRQGKRSHEIPEITADEKYQITPDDLQNGYRGFCGRLLQVLSSL